MNISIILHLLFSTQGVGYKTNFFLKIINHLFQSFVILIPIDRDKLLVTEQDHFFSKKTQLSPFLRSTKMWHGLHKASWPLAQFSPRISDNTITFFQLIIDPTFWCILIYFLKNEFTRNSIFITLKWQEILPANFTRHPKWRLNVDG